jgi:hypothetical protein
VPHTIVTTSRRRTLVAAVVALLLAQVVVLVGSTGPAQAATCTPPYSYGQFSPEVGVGFDWAPQCSDGVAQISDGTVYDRLCDSRAAYAWFEIYDRQSNGSWVRIATSPKFSALNDCGTSSTFATWRARSPGTIGWKLVTLLQACNFWSCSSLRTYENTG